MFLFTMSCCVTCSLPGRFLVCLYTICTWLCQMNIYKQTSHLCLLPSLPCHSVLWSNVLLSVYRVKRKFSKCKIKRVSEMNHLKNNTKRLKHESDRYHLHVSIETIMVGDLRIKKTHLTRYRIGKNRWTKTDIWKFQQWKTWCFSVWKLLVET